MNLCKRYVKELAADVTRVAQSQGDPVFAGWVEKQCERAVRWTESGIVSNFEAARAILQLEADWLRVKELAKACGEED